MYGAVCQTSRLTVLPLVLLFTCVTGLYAEDAAASNEPVVAPVPQQDLAPVVALVPLSTEPTAAVLVAQNADAKKDAEPKADDKPKAESAKPESAAPGSEKKDNKPAEKQGANENKRQPKEGRGGRRGRMGGFGVFRGMRRGGDAAGIQRRGEGRGPNAEALFKRMDKNGDGSLTLEEFATGAGQMRERRANSQRAGRGDSDRGGRHAFGKQGHRRMGIHRGRAGRGGAAGFDRGRGGRGRMMAFHRGGFGHDRSFAFHGGNRGPWRGFGMRQRGIGRFAEAFADRGHGGGGRGRIFAWHGAGHRGDSDGWRGFGARGRGHGRDADRERRGDRGEDRARSSESRRGHNDDRVKKLEAEIKELRQLIAELKKDKSA